MAPSDLGFQTSGTAMLMVIIGSGEVFWGPAVGAGVVTLVQYFASLVVPARWPLILGALFILAVMFIRGGIGRRLVMLWQKERAREGLKG